MNETKVKQLAEASNENKELAKELQDLNAALAKESIEKTVIIANKYGIDISEEDLLPGEDLSLEELDSVAGGGGGFCIFIGFGQTSDFDSVGTRVCKIVGAGLG